MNFLARLEKVPSFVVLLGALIFACVLGFYSFFEPFSRDQGIHATIAYGLDRGLLPYRDIYNIKPPLTTAAHWVALTMFGHSMAAIRIFDFVAVLAAAAGIVRITIALGRTRNEGILAGLFLVSMHYSNNFWTRAQTDSWASFLVVGCLVAILAAWECSGRKRSVWMAVAGAILALAFLFKYTIAGVGLIVFVPLAIGRPDRVLVWRDLAWFAVGGTIVIVVVAGAMSAVGVLKPFLEIQDYIRGYIALETAKSVSPWFKGVKVFYGNRLLAAFALVGMIGLIPNILGRRGGTLCAVIAVWLFSAWLSGYSQGKGFLYQYMPLLPPVAILAALAFQWCFELIRGRLPSLVAGGIGVLVAITLCLSPRIIASDGRTMIHFWRGQTLQTLWAGRYERSNFSIDELLSLNAALNRIRRPGDGLFLWGYETAIYFLQEIPPAHRFPYAWPFAVNFYDGRYTSDLMSRLQANPPEFFVVQKEDTTPFVTGHEFDSAAILDRNVRLRAFLDSRYKRVHEQNRFDVWRLSG